MNAKVKNYGGCAEAMKRDQPVVGSNDPVARHVASTDQSDDASAICAPTHGRFSKLLKAMYYWVHSRS